MNIPIRRPRKPEKPNRHQKAPNHRRHQPKFGLCMPICACEGGHVDEFILEEVDCAADKEAHGNSNESEAGFAEGETVLALEGEGEGGEEAEEDGEGEGGVDCDGLDDGLEDEHLDGAGEGDGEYELEGVFWWGTGWKEEATLEGAFLEDNRLVGFLHDEERNGEGASYYKDDPHGPSPALILSQISSHYRSKSWS